MIFHMLIDENFPEGITTGYEDPICQLFVPMLKQSTHYDVAVGYFTSGWLRDTASGLAEFAILGGKSRWIVSPFLNEQDANIIVETQSSAGLEIAYRERKLLDAIRALEQDSRSELCALIAAGILQFRIAEPISEHSDGMLHAKIGIATDSDGNKIGFSGSYNLTSKAKFNWENIEIYRSWNKSEEKRILRMANRFDNLWSNKDPTYQTFPPSRKFIQIVTREAGSRLSDFRNREMAHIKELPKFRDYQLEAIESWGKNNGRGTFVMATGSGKTITALGTIDRLIKGVVVERSRPLIVVIVLPLKHLLEQWHREAAGFGLDAIKCYEASVTWRQKLKERISTLMVSGKGYSIALTTNATFAGEKFQEIIKSINFDFLLVADEAHNLGSPTYLNSLPSNANFRLALSATPERHNDIFGTKKLFEYFGQAVIEFELEDAIDADYLCPYKYYAHVCYMSESEYDEYLDLSLQVRDEASSSNGGSGKSKKQLQLEGKRADLITRVESKLEKLSDLLRMQRKHTKITHTLIYCGSRKGENSERHIERAVRLVGELGIKVRKFTATESMDDRKEILSLFASGSLQIIAAIKCLDEGVDIPETRVAYILASTTNPREYIQRRGRVLRKSEGKEFAIIHDFIILPPATRVDESELLDREMERAVEFSRLSLNRDECINQLETINAEACYE